MNGTPTGPDAPDPPQRDHRTLDAPTLDHLYTRLAEALGRVGEQHAPLLLATLALDLIASGSDAARVVAAIDRSERLALL